MTTEGFATMSTKKVQICFEKMFFTNSTRNPAGNFSPPSIELFQYTIPKVKFSLAEHSEKSRTLSNCIEKLCSGTDPTTNSYVSIFTVLSTVTEKIINRPILE